MYKNVFYLKNVLFKHEIIYFIKKNQNWTISSIKNKCSKLFDELFASLRRKNVNEVVKDVEIPEFLMK